MANTSEGIFSPLILPRSLLVTSLISVVKEILFEFIQFDV